MDKFMTERRSVWRYKYLDELPRVIKPVSFYLMKGAEVFSPNASIQVVTQPRLPVVSLKCPLSHNRQVFPVRTVECQHVESFDLGSFIDTLPVTALFRMRILGGNLGYQPHVAPHTCPLCSVKAPLYIDAIILDLLRHHPDVDAMSITSTGQLIPCHKSSSSGHPVIDLASPSPSLLNPASPLPPPNLVSPTLPLPAFIGNLDAEKSTSRRRFSFGELTLGQGCKSGRRYSRLSTVDLTVDSPC